MNPNFKINRELLPSLASLSVLTPDAVIHKQDERSLALTEIDINKVIPVCFYTDEEKAIFYSSKDITPMKADILLRRAKEDGRIMLDAQILQALVSEPGSDTRATSYSLSEIYKANIEKQAPTSREISWAKVNMLAIGTTYKDESGLFLLYADQNKGWELSRVYLNMFNTQGTLPPEAYFLMYNK